MTLFRSLRERLQRQLVIAHAPAARLAERQLILQALGTAHVNRLRQRLGGLYEAEFSALSQWGEDGIIDWLVERLPDIPHTFIEFGVEDYRESNTRLLLQLRNWSGLVMDGSQSHIRDIQEQEIYWRHDLQAKCAFVDRDNINNLLTDAGMRGEIGLLSVDIDGNDYWVWQAIEVVSPGIVVCEYNAVLGDRYALTVPYQADFQRTRAHHSNLYFGASLRALVDLGQHKGYTFVGTTSTGCNAFFVRNNLAPAIASALEGIWAFPSAVREARGDNGQLVFTRGIARAQMIDQLPLVDLVRNTPTTLAACTNLYSPEWSEGARTRI